MNCCIRNILFEENTKKLFEQTEESRIPYVDGKPAGCAMIC